MLKSRPARAPSSAAGRPARGRLAWAASMLAPRLRAAASCATTLTLAASAWAQPAPTSAALADGPLARRAADLGLVPWLPVPVGPPSVLKPAQTPRTLDATTLLQLALEQNADVIYARLQARVAEEGLAAEGGLFRPIAYASYRTEGRRRQRTVEERLTAALGGITVLNEQVLAGEVGLKTRTPSGADFSVGLRSTRNRSNVIGSATFAPSDREANGSFVLTVRQPLLRGAGRDVMETDLRVAQAEREIGRWQYRQQLMRVGSDALSAYWQLLRAQQGQALREAALDNARSALRDARLRTEGGRLAPSALEDAEASVASRQADLARGEQLLLDAQARVRQLLDLPETDARWQLKADDPAAGLKVPSPAELAERLSPAADTWPPLRVARLKREQAEHRLILADNRSLPAVDVHASYASTSLTYGPVEAAQQALRGGHPDWTLGVQMEVPLGGDARAQAERRAQALRVQQAELEVHSVRQSFGNDLFNRAAQLQALQSERALAWREVQARQALATAEETQHASGVIPLARLLRRQAEVIEAQQRLLDVDARLGLARVALQLVDGSLLSAYHVRVDDNP